MQLRRVGALLAATLSISLAASFSVFVACAPNSIAPQALADDTETPPSEDVAKDTTSSDDAAAEAKSETDAKVRGTVEELKQVKKESSSSSVGQGSAEDFLNSYYATMGRAKGPKD